MSHKGLTPQVHGKITRKAASLMLRKMFTEEAQGRGGPRRNSGTKSKKSTTNSNKPNKRRQASDNGRTTPKATLPPRKSLHTKSSTSLPSIAAKENPHDRKSTPTTDPLHYKSRTLPRPQSRPQNNPKENLRWVVDSRVQLEETAARRDELESRGTIARRMRARKMANNSTSIHWTDKVEYTTDMMRSYADADKYPNRDPFADLKRAKQLKQQLQTSTLDLGTGFGGSKDVWTTDNRAWDNRVAAAVAKENGGKGRNPLDDKRKAFALKQALQKTTLNLDMGHKSDWLSDMQVSQSHAGTGTPRDPFADRKRAIQLKQQLQTSTLDLGTGFGGSKDVWTTDNRAWDNRVAAAVAKENGGKGRNPLDDKRKAFALKQALQKTTLQLGFDDRYM